MAESVHMQQLSTSLVSTGGWHHAWLKPMWIFRHLESSADKTKAVLPAPRS